MVGLIFAIANIKHEYFNIIRFRFFMVTICGIVILILDILDCIKALFAKEKGDFMQRMNTGVLDIVLWNTVYLGRAVDVLRVSGKKLMTTCWYIYPRWAGSILT